MDKSLYISMNSAYNAMRQLEVMTNNLANVNTTAFRADSTYVQQQPVKETGMQSRVYSKLDKTYTDFKKGSILSTDRDLDIALDGDGFIAVQSKSGKEAYTRAGSLQLKNGVLTTQSGELVLGNGGAINISNADRISIAPDGTISARYIGETEMVAVDRIKLTNPQTSELQKGPDSLFYLPNGGTAPQDENVKIVSGSLEGSNVSAIETMTQLIDLTRHYQIHTNYMKTIADNTAKSNQLLEIR
jgi:flagellar basal-body rod protein FlgF